MDQNIVPLAVIWTDYHLDSWKNWRMQAGRITLLKGVRIPVEAICILDFNLEKIAFVATHLLIKKKELSLIAI